MPVPPAQQPGPDDLAYHKVRYSSGPVLNQVDEAVAYVVRDLPGQLGDGLKRNFPTASAALPVAKWQQLGLAALGLLGVNWLIGLGPEMATSLVWLSGVGLAGYAGWNILNHTRLARRDGTAQRFAEHTAELASEGIEQRIAGLAALDQLAYDHPRYRRPLVHLLAAWLDGRAALGHEAASGADCSVARQMLVEFQQMQLVDAEVGRERGAGAAFLESVFPATAAAVTKPAAQAAADAPDVSALEVAATEDPTATEPTLLAETTAEQAASAAEPASEAHVLEVVEAVDLPTSADEAPEEPALPQQRASAGE